MADYVSPTVVTPPIPLACMTPIERFILTTLFQFEPADEGRALYFYAEDGIDDEVSVSRCAFDAIADTYEPGIDRLVMLIDMQMRERSQREDSAPLIAFINELDPLNVLQSIVKRHGDVLPIITIHQAFTCSTMRPDGFGGAATVIHASGIDSLCTTSWALDRIMAIKAHPRLIEGRS